MDGLIAWLCPLFQTIRGRVRRAIAYGAQTLFDATSVFLIALVVIRATHWFMSYLITVLVLFGAGWQDVIVFTDVDDPQRG